MKRAALVYAASQVAIAMASLNVLPDVDSIKREVTPENDPVRFSVLSILHTAIPSDALSSMAASPTPFSNANQPDWYKNLPGDVKSLLPILYPETDNTYGGSSTCTPSTSTVYVTNTYTVTSGTATPVETAAPTELTTWTGGYVLPGTGSVTAPISSTRFVSVPPYANSTAVGPSANATSTSTFTFTSGGTGSVTGTATGSAPAEQTTNGAGAVGFNMLSLVLVAVASAWLYL